MCVDIYPFLPPTRPLCGSCHHGLFSWNSATYRLLRSELILRSVIYICVYRHDRIFKQLYLTNIGKLPIVVSVDGQFVIILFINQACV